MKKLAALVDIRAGEGALVALTLLYSVCNAATDILVNTVAYALFLSKFDAQRLPYIYIGVSISSVLAAMFYLKLSQRYTLAQMLFGAHLLLLLTLIGYRASLVFSEASWLIFSLPIAYGVISVLLYVVFWNLVGRLFNLQQGKRLFGLFGAGQQVTGLVAGFGAPLLVTWLGTPNLLAAAALTGGGSLWLLSSMSRRFPILHKREAEESDSAGKSEASTQQLLGDHYVRLIFVMFALFTLGSYFVDNIFYNRLESQYASADQMASFLGVFNGVNGGLSLVSQIFVANRLLKQYGVRAAVILTPLLLLTSAILFVLAGSVFGATAVLFWLAACMNLILLVMSDTDNTAGNLLYQPLPAALRTRTQTVADGILSPLAVGLAGVVLLLLTSVLRFDALHLAYVLLLILVGWAIAGRLLGNAYGERVQQALRQRIIQPFQRNSQMLRRNGRSLGFLADRASLEVIQQTLANPHPGAVIYALDVLEANSRHELARCLPGLLEHPSAYVRLEAVRRLERLGDPAALPAIEACWRHDREGTVRSAALRTVAVLGGAQSFDELYTYLTSSDVETKRSVMIGFVRSGELEAILAAGEALTSLVNSPNSMERIFAAQVLGESGIAGFYRPLLKMIADPHPQVRRAALYAAGKLQHPKLWPQMIAILNKGTGDNVK